MRLKVSKFVKTIVDELKGLTLLQIMGYWLIFVVGGSVLHFIMLYSDQGIYSVIHEKALEPNLFNFWQTIYFSFITATTVGYGNLVPQGFGEVIVMVQILASMTFFTLFLSKIASQDYFTMIENMYTKSFDEKMKLLRNALWNFRENTSYFIKKGKKKKSFTRHELEELHLHLLSYMSTLGEIELATTETSEVRSHTSQVEEEKLFLNILLSTNTLETMFIFFKEKEIMNHHVYLKGIVNSIMDRLYSLQDNFDNLKEVEDFSEAYNQYTLTMGRLKNLLKDKSLLGKLAEDLT